MAGDNPAPLVSIVVPCYNEEEVFPLLREALEGVAAKLQPAHRVELVFVDDGSTDATWKAIEAFAADDDRVAGLSLSRNFGHQMALTCGYDAAQGDAIVAMDADLQDPPEVILEMVERWQAGADIVFATRTAREGESGFKLWTAALFYRLMHRLGATHVKENSGDFRLMSRRALNALGSMREQHRFLRGMVGWLGFRTDEVDYVRKKRQAGRTKYHFRNMLRLAVDASVSFSIVPLRMTFVFATLLSLVVFVYLAYAGTRYLFFGAELVPGWTSLVLITMLFGVVNLLSLGILGEYVGRIYEQAKGRPLYLINDNTRPDAAQAPQGPGRPDRAPDEEPQREARPPLPPEGDS